MTISIWRYSHMLLAISSSIFLTLASITGIILAIEPITENQSPYKIDRIKSISVSETIEVLQLEYDQIITVKITDSDFVIASVINKEGESETIYINPKNGKRLGRIEQKHPVFKFATNLHRSLFLKSIGRFFVGFVSLLLVVIVITGIFLILKRQGGIKKFFSKVTPESPNQYFHVVLGRWLFIPILIIAITGVYLSLEKFSLLPKHNFSNEINFNQTDKKTAPWHFHIFKITRLADVKSIEFPFSEDIEDYFKLELKNKELIINQFDGSIIKENVYPFFAVASYYSFLLHTGKGNVLWSLVLLLCSCSLLFFMYSGFFMTIKRQKSGKLVNLASKDECEYVILVGSETGTTFNFARAFSRSLTKIGKQVFVSELNTYSTYNKAKHLIVFTSTYGDGESPANANKFTNLFQNTEPINPLQFSVIGLGSTKYPEYCKYAGEIDKMLNTHEKFNPVMPLFKINEQSIEAFQKWATTWKQNTKTPLEEINTPTEKMFRFTVIHKTKINKDHTFLLQLRPPSHLKFESGDLIAIRPNADNSHPPRLYSIGKIDRNIVLSIKKHDLGLCSNYLNTLTTTNQLQASIRTNPKFHFPDSAPEVLMIANGTGIAPFLGMIFCNNKNIKKHIIWGVRTNDSLDIYQKQINPRMLEKRLISFQIAYSKELKSKTYVQDLIKKEKELVTDILSKNGTIMICGSMQMQKGVIAVLEEIIQTKLNTTIQELISKGQIRMDCY
ncbi:PepSY domain-containing protein [Aquimarina pacifica]|uniref:PepSY domain-containing protein n=1 Tax=Aquimarina pacifica TaxID=1296415 RepID=UPI000472F90F|nr:PepSY domain-containing protein [Aquimarina pacifica]